MWPGRSVGHPSTDPEPGPAQTRPRSPDSGSEQGQASRTGCTGHPHGLWAQTVPRLRRALLAQVAGVWAMPGAGEAGPAGDSRREGWVRPCSARGGGAEAPSSAGAVSPALTPHSGPPHASVSSRGAGRCRLPRFLGRKTHIGPDAQTPAQSPCRANAPHGAPDGVPAASATEVRSCRGGGCGAAAQ